MFDSLTFCSANLFKISSIMLTSIDEFNQRASAIEPIRLVEASSTLHLAVGYLPIPIVRRFMPLSFASSQNSLLSTTRARNYDDIILLSSYLTDFSDFFGVNKDISIQPRTISTLTLPLHTCTSSTTRTHLRSLNALAPSSPVA